MNRSLIGRLGAAGRSLSLTVLLSLLLSPIRSDDLRVLIVGGGPEPSQNQVSIESNVRYMLKILPAGSVATVLFADGSRHNATVVYEEKTRPFPPGERILKLLLHNRAAALPTISRYRAPLLSQIDGSLSRAELAAAFEKLPQGAGETAQSFLLYFTGHGRQAKDRDLNNNVFDLWAKETLSVRELAAHLKRLPMDRPVTLVMVQCYSGSFANLLFEEGDPNGPTTQRDIAGFFATVRERVAAGCTPELNEAEYHDFTSYFFAAMAGVDRVGRTVRGADYNRDGRVGMDEAYCYTLIHNISMDVPTCTSDLFLRRFMTMQDEEIFKTSYATVLSWTTPAQRAALESLSRSLKLSGDDRGQTAYLRMRGLDPNRPAQNPLASARRRYARAHQQARRELFMRWPALETPGIDRWEQTRKEAQRTLESLSKTGVFHELLEAETALTAAEQQEYQREIEEARLMRFVRLFKTVVLTHALREGTDESLKSCFDRLIAAESRALLPPLRASAERAP
jgi:hypothetical protein